MSNKRNPNTKVTLTVQTLAMIVDFDMLDRACQEAKQATIDGLERVKHAYSDEEHAFLFVGIAQSAEHAKGFYSIKKILGEFLR